MRIVKYKRNFINSDKVQNATLVNADQSFIDWLRSLSPRAPGKDVITGKDWYPTEIEVIEKSKTAVK